MVLTIALPQPEKGSRLIEVVSESMQELEEDNWEFSQHRRMEYLPLWLSTQKIGSFSMLAYTAKENVARKKEHKRKFHSYERRLTSNKTSLELNRHTSVQHLLWFTDSISLPFYLGIVNLGSFALTGKLFFSSFIPVHTDSVSILLDPKETYQSLHFLVHSSSDFNSCSGGEIASTESEGFQKIAPTLYKLETEVRNRLSQERYRSPAIQF